MIQYKEKNKDKISGEIIIVGAGSGGNEKCGFRG
jgi:hypothetical protein